MACLAEYQLLLYIFLGFAVGVPIGSALAYWMQKRAWDAYLDMLADEGVYHAETGCDCEEHTKS